MEITIKNASEVFKVSRTTIYEKIKNGDLSKGQSGRVEMSELIRVFGSPEERRTKKEEKVQIEQLLKDRGNKPNTEPKTDNLDTEKEKMYKERIQSLEEQLKQALERELWNRQHTDKLTETIKLLEAPKADGFFKRLF